MDRRIGGHWDEMRHSVRLHELQNTQASWILLHTTCNISHCCVSYYIDASLDQNGMWKKPWLFNDRDPESSSFLGHDSALRTTVKLPSSRTLLTLTLHYLWHLWWLSLSLSLALLLALTHTHAHTHTEKHSHVWDMVFTLNLRVWVYIIYRLSAPALPRQARRHYTDWSAF